MSGPRIDLHRELLGGVTRALIDRLSVDERAAVEAATGEMGNKPDAVKLGWLRMRTGDAWTKQRYAVTVGRALAKLREMVAAEDTLQSGSRPRTDRPSERPRPTSN